MGFNLKQLLSLITSPSWRTEEYTDSELEEMMKAGDEEAAQQQETQNANSWEEEPAADDSGWVADPGLGLNDTMPTWSQPDDSGSNIYSDTGLNDFTSQEVPLDTQAYADYVQRLKDDAAAKASALAAEYAASQAETSGGAGIDWQSYQNNGLNDSAPTWSQPDNSGSGVYSDTGLNDFTSQEVPLDTEVYANYVQRLKDEAAAKANALAAEYAASQAETSGGAGIDWESYQNNGQGDFTWQEVSPDTQAYANYLQNKKDATAKQKSLQTEITTGDPISSWAASGQGAKQNPDTGVNTSSGYLPVISHGFIGKFPNALVGEWNRILKDPQQKGNDGQQGSTGKIVYGPKEDPLKSSNGTEQGDIANRDSAEYNGKEKDADKGTEHSELGVISAKYESNGNPGVISNNSGDPGGKSYGAWQFNSKDKIVIKFYEWTKDYNKDIYTKLNSAYIADGNTNGTYFDSAWKQIASENPTAFLQLQHDYTKEKYYDAAARCLLEDTGFDINKQSSALQNVLWSAAVHHGVKGSVRIFEGVDLTASQSDIITAIYNERQKVDVYFPGCSQKIKNSVYNRMIQEKADALKLLNDQ